MLNGRLDFIFPVGSSQEPMCRVLGTPKEHQRRIVYDAGHDIPRNGEIKEALNGWDFGPRLHRRVEPGRENPICKQPGRGSDPSVPN